MKNKFYIFITIGIWALMSVLFLLALNTWFDKKYYEAILYTMLFIYSLTLERERRSLKRSIKDMEKLEKIMGVISEKKFRVKSIHVDGNNFEIEFYRENDQE